MADDHSENDQGTDDDAADETDAEHGGEGADPFDSLDADEYRDRGGDPFDALGGASEADSRSESRTDEDRDYEPDGVRSDVGIPSGDPFADIDGDESPLDSGSSGFEAVDVGEVDADDVWKRLVGKPGPQSATVAPGEEVEVPKHAYCETCEHFSPPPAVHCTHEGTQILEFLDMETVRVVNCPVVEERRRLGHDE